MGLTRSSGLLKYKANMYNTYIHVSKTLMHINIILKRKAIQNKRKTVYKRT